MVSDLIPPREDPGENAFAAGFRALVSLLPGGGPLGEAFQWFVKPGYDRRLKIWFDITAREVIDHRRRINQNEADLQRLQTDERFLSTLVTAARIAGATHSQEKLEALRNAVVNVAVGIDVDEIERQLFLRYVDEFTELHLRILSFGAISPKPSEFGAWGEVDALVRTVLVSAFPELSANEVLCQILWDDLSDRGLVFPAGHNERIRTGTWRHQWTTHHGDRFLAFISLPPSQRTESQ